MLWLIARIKLYFGLQTKYRIQIPSQRKPLMRWPKGHTQRKEPNVFSQWAPNVQNTLKHSFISEKMHTNVIYWVNYYKIFIYLHSYLHQINHKIQCLFNQFLRILSQYHEKGHRIKKCMYSQWIHNQVTLHIVKMVLCII